jgi:hypothetical protein
MSTTRGYELEPDLVARDGPAAQSTLDDTGVGWVTFAAITLGFAGVFAIVDGIVALSRSKFYAVNAVYVFSDLRTWGWIILILGIAALFAAALLVSGSQWARWFGIAMAAINGLGQLMFVQAYPWWSVAMFAVDVLVIYALAVYGGKQRIAT